MHGNRMLEMRAGLAVASAASPSVSLLKDILAAHVNHRLDGDGHSVLDERSSATSPIIGHFGILMEFLAHTVAHKLPYDSISSLLAIVLNSVSDVANTVSRNRLLDAYIEGLLGSAKQLLYLFLYLSDTKCVG